MSYYVADYNLLIRFDDYNRMKIFLENEPTFHQAYGREACTYPQYKLVSDRVFRDELIVDTRGYVVGCFVITYWGEYRGMKFYKHFYKLT